MTRSLLLVLVLSSFLRSVIGADPTPITLESIVKTLRAREQALTSFEIHGLQFVSDEDGERIPNTYGYEFTYVQTNQGQREMRIVRIAPDGSRSVSEWVRDDGTKTYSMQCTPKSEAVIESVAIRKTPNQPSRSAMPMNPYLNMLSPRGKTLSKIVATGKSMRVFLGDSGEEVVEMKVSDNGYEFGIRLSGEHDYVLRDLIFSDRVRNIVTSFRNIEGFWFPESGYSKMVDAKGGDLRFSYRIDSIKVNPEKSTMDFGLPKLNIGTLVYDETNSGLPRVYGVPVKDEERARKAVEQLRSEYGSNSEAAKDSAPSTNLSSAASTDPERSGIPGTILISGAAFALVLAGYLYMRR